MASADQLERQAKQPAVPFTSLNSAQVRTLQAVLREHGYNPGPVDGILGPRTRDAWVRFTQANGLDPNAVPGEVWSAAQGYSNFKRSAPVQTGSAPSAPIPTAGSSASGGGDAAVEASSVPELPTPGIDGAEEDRIREQYPSFAVWLDHPEVGPMLRQAVQEQWAPDRLRARLEATNWWKTTASSRRVWDRDYAHDPATMEARIDKEVVNLQNLTRSYGITLPDDQLRTFAIGVLRDGLDQSQLLRQIGTTARAIAAGQPKDAPDAGLQGGLASIAQNLARSARAMHLSYQPNQLREWAIRIFEGQATMEGIQGLFRSQAKTMYSHLADQIDQGMTVEDYFTPLKNYVARGLELDPSAVDLMDPKWAELTQLVDDKGTIRPMTYSEAGRWYRSQEEFWQTREGSEKVYGALNGLGEAFGKI